MSIAISIRTPKSSQSRPKQWRDRHVRVSRTEDGRWKAYSTIGGIAVSGEYASNPWAAIGEMLTAHLNWLDFYNMGSTNGAARAVFGDGLVQTGQDDTGHFVEYFCGEQWNRIHFPDKAHADETAIALRRFHDYKLERDK